MEKIKKFFQWIFANKKSLCGTVTGAVGAGAGIVASWTIPELPSIMAGNYNIAPILYTVICVVMFALNALGVSGKGFESVVAFFARCAADAEKADEKAIEKAAERAIKEEQRASEAIEKEAKKQLEAEQKAKQDAIIAAKIEAKKAELLANEQNK